jgi:hypothetical protein
MCGRGAQPVSGWQEFVTNLVANGAWPLVVLILGLTFRRTLRGVLERITGFEGLGAKLDFAESIKRIDVGADVVDFATRGRRSDEFADAPHDDTADDEQPSRLTGNSVRREWVTESTPSTIMESWAEIESAIRRLYHDAVGRGLLNGIVPEKPSLRRLSFKEVLSKLATAQILREHEVNLLEELRETRNRVAYESILPSEGQALTYLEGSKTANRILQRANARAYALSKAQEPTKERLSE